MHKSLAPHTPAHRGPAIWLVLPCLAVAAWLTAKGIHRLIEEGARPIPALPLLVDRGSGDLLPPEAPVDEGLNGCDLFAGQPGPEPPAPPGGAPPGAGDPGPPPVRLPVLLVGTVVSSDADWSLAFIQDQRTRTTELYRPGDLLVGRARIEDILSDRVWLRVDGQIRSLVLADRQGTWVPQAAPRPGAADQLTGLIQPVGTDRYRVDRSGLATLLERPGDLARQARVAMAFSADGTLEGVRLTGLDPSSALGQLGLKRQDVIRRVNGHALDSPERMLEVYNQLKDARRIEVEVQSGARRRVLRFSLE